MENLGERLVGDYLRYVKGCDFIEFNVCPKGAVQVELDVVGIMISERHAYICEVATMLETGLHYGPDTSATLITKFTKALKYREQIFSPEWNVEYMLWSPVVKEPSQKNALDSAQLEIAQTGIKIIPMINEQYLEAIGELRQKAREIKSELKSPLMRFLQMEERLKHKYLGG